MRASFLKARIHPIIIVILFEPSSNHHHGYRAEVRPPQDRPEDGTAHQLRPGGGGTGLEAAWYVPNIPSYLLFRVLGLTLCWIAFNYLLGNFGRPDNDHPDRRSSGASNMAGMVYAAQQNARAERDTTPSIPGDSRYVAPHSHLYNMPLIRSHSNGSHVNDTASREESSFDIDDDSGREAVNDGDGISPTNTGPTYRDTVPPSYNTVNETTYYPDNAVRESRYYPDDTARETTTTEYVPGAPGIIRPI